MCLGWDPPEFPSSSTCGGRSTPGCGAYPRFTPSTDLGNERAAVIEFIQAEREMTFSHPTQES
jgi:hypothetical protein